MSNAIPVIDLNPLFSEKKEGLQKVADELYRVYSTIGFGLVINHQIPPNIISDIFKASKNFHALSQSEKMQIKYQQHLRGYLPMNISTLKTSELGQAKKPNQSESYMLLNESLAYETVQWRDSVFAGKNPWPSRLPDFQNQVMHYYDALLNLSKKLIRAFSVSLQFSPEYLHQYFTDPNIFLRLLYYPPVPNPNEQDLFGSAPHTDYGCITLLVQDDTGGLQVKTQDDQWLDVPCLKNAFVLNTGQMMAVWSNGKLKATPHRVLSNGKKSRYSIPFFYNCNLETYVKPLPGSVTNKHPLKVEAVNYGEHLEKTLRANYIFK